MTKVITKKGLILLFFIITFVFANPTRADFLNTEKRNEYDENINKIVDQTDINTTNSLDDIISSIIRMVMTALGTIFLVLMFLAGNNWMTAQGNKEKIEEAQKKILSLSIGLVIVLTAYALSSWISRILASVIAN
ncbi:MAG: hypothetical protein PWQ35_181 [Patescibacteria group bacterium]|nr:hypothetical protein [Patescibacteria group bacterium]